MAPLAPSSPLPTASAPASWAGVEHRHLASLTAVARTGSFRGAARALGYSQSALSQQISQLERLVGATVANRRRGSSEVTLTPAGEAVLRRAQPILAVHRAAQADMAAFAGGQERLRVGIAEHLGLGLAGASLATFLQRHPSAHVEVERDADGGRLLDQLALGQLDVVLGDPPRDDDRALGAKLLAPEEVVLLAPASWSVVRRADASADELLAHLPLAVDTADPDMPRVLDDLRAAGVAPAATTRVDGPAAVRALVAAGAAAALVPAGAVDPGDPAVVALPLTGLVGPRAVGVMWQARRLHAPLVDTFVAAVARNRGHAAATRHAATTTPATRWGTTAATGY